MRDAIDVVSPGRCALRTDPPAPRWPERWVRRASWLTIGWMSAFALVHVYWLLGGRGGLPRAESIYERPALVVVDAVAVPLCVAGAVLARSLVWPPQRRPTPVWRLRLITAAAALLVLHAAPTVPTWVALAAGRDVDLGDDERFVTSLYEPVFLAGGLLCAACAACSRATGVRIRTRRDRAADHHAPIEGAP